MKALIILLLVFFIPKVYAICDGTVESITVPDPVNKGIYEIRARVYRPAATDFPVVFILPPIVGETPLDGALAGTFCVSGLGAYILDVLNDPPEAEEIVNLNSHEDTLIRAELALNLFIARLNQDPQVRKNYGLLGASQGGIISSYLAGVNPSIKSLVILAAGGNVPEILATSEQESVKNLREKRMVAFNITTQEEYENLVRPYFTLEPTLVARNVPENSVLQFIMTRDVDVPTKNQRELRTAFRSPKVIEINNTHLEGIIQASTLEAGRILKFFQDRL